MEESEVPKLLREDRFVLQEKHDGRRMLVCKNGTDITGINRKGLIVVLPASIAGAAAALPVDCLIDGEAVGETLQAFDLLEVSGQDVRQRGYLDRFTGLLRLLDATSAIRPVTTEVDPDRKLAFFHKLRDGGAEGVVFKDRDSRFSSGRPASGGSQLKFKFVTAASFIVSSVSKQKRSISLALLDRSRQVTAKNVTIPPNQEIPPTRSVVEVR